RALSEHQVVMTPEELGKLYREYIEYYGAHIADHSRPFDGLEPALDRLAAAGYVLAVCTNKLEQLSVQLLEQLGLARPFAPICGPDTFNVHKPDPEMLRLTVARAGGALHRALMVGDSVTDIDMARAAGVPVVAVDFGYSEIPVTQLGADRVIGSFHDLPS